MSDMSDRKVANFSRHGCTITSEFLEDSRHPSVTSADEIPKVILTAARKVWPVIVDRTIVFAWKHGGSYRNLRIVYCPPFVGPVDRFQQGPPRLLRATLAVVFEVRRPHPRPSFYIGDAIEFGDVPSWDNWEQDVLALLVRFATDLDEQTIALDSGSSGPFLKELRERDYAACEILPKLSEPSPS